MSVVPQLNADLKTAMKAHDKLALNVIRMIKTAMTNEQIKVGHDLTDDEEVAVLARELKQRRESLVEFQAAKRADLVNTTAAEIKLVEKYAPQQLSADEVQQVVAESIAAVQATSMADFGKVMGVVMPKVKGRADGALVNQTVKAQLTAQN